MNQLKIAVMLLVGHALAVLSGTAVTLAVFGIFHSAGSTDGSPAIAATLGGAIWLAFALYPLSFVVVLPFSMIPAIILLSRRIRSLPPYLIAGAVIPALAIFLTRLIATDDPFVSEQGPAMIAGIAGGMTGSYVLWLVGIRSIRRDMPAT